MIPRSIPLSAHLQHERLPLPQNMSRHEAVVRSRKKSSASLPTRMTRMLWTRMTLRTRSKPMKISTSRPRVGELHGRPRRTIWTDSWRMMMKTLQRIRTDGERAKKRGPRECSPADQQERARGFPRRRPEMMTITNRTTTKKRTTRLWR